MSWHSRLRSVLAVAIAVAGLIGTSSATSADTQTAGASPQLATKVQAAITVGTRLQAEIKLLDPYVVTSAHGTLALSPPAAVTLQVDPGDMATLRTGLTTVNEQIRAGKLVTTAGHQLVDPNAVDFNVQWNQTKHVWNWWGMQYYFSEYWTTKIEGLANMGAASSTLCAVIAAALLQPEVALLCAVAGAVLWFGAGWLQWADNGGGVVISETWTPFPTGGIWISGQ